MCGVASWNYRPTLGSSPFSHLSHPRVRVRVRVKVRVRIRLRLDLGLGLG